MKIRVISEEKKKKEEKKDRRSSMCITKISRLIYIIYNIAVDVFVVEFVCRWTNGLAFENKFPVVYIGIVIDPILTAGVSEWRLGNGGCWWFPPSGKKEPHAVSATLFVLFCLKHIYIFFFSQYKIVKWKMME